MCSVLISLCVREQQLPDGSVIPTHCIPFQVRNYDDGQTIIAEGEPGLEFFIIQEGNCHCLKRTLKF